LKSKLFCLYIGSFAQRVLIKGIVTTTQNLIGLQRVTNQSNCNCFIYLLQIPSLRFVFHLHYYHVHQILVYHNVLVTQPIDPPMRGQSIVLPMCAHCNCQGSHYFVGPKVGVHNIVDRTYPSKHVYLYHMLTILNVIPFGLPKVFTLSPIELGQRRESLSLHKFFMF
jgi:hypothetical protein